MFLALYICVLFISVMQSVNGAQFLNNISLLLLFGLSPVSGATVLVPLASMYLLI